MNSKNLIETGFSEWFPLKTITISNMPQDKGSVIIIIDKELSEKPESDILYIGRTKKAAKKILGGYLAGYGGKNTKKINQMLFDEGYIEKAAISWILTDKPRIMQEGLLAKFKEAHGEFPVWNTKQKLSAKIRLSPTFKHEKVPSPKTKSVSPKTIARTTKKPVPKSKIAKPELANKEETVAEASEKTTKNETTSNDQMTV